MLERSYKMLIWVLISWFFSSFSAVFLPSMAEKILLFVSLEVDMYFERWLELLLKESWLDFRVASKAGSFCWNSNEGNRSKLCLRMILHIFFLFDDIIISKKRHRRISTAKLSPSYWPLRDWQRLKYLLIWYTSVWDQIFFSDLIKKKMSDVGYHSLERRSKSTRTRKRLQKKQQSEKENGFVLDCLNQSKSKLQAYNSIQDKFLNYFVIRVHPNLNKPNKHHTTISKVSKVEHSEQLNHTRFQEMLLKQKAKLASTSR